MHGKAGLLSFFRLRFYMLDPMQNTKIFEKFVTNLCPEGANHSHLSRRFCRATAGVGHCAGEAEQGVPCISGALVAGAECEDLGLCVVAEGLGCVVGLTDVGQLVADSVGDDVCKSGVG